MVVVVILVVATIITVTSCSPIFIIAVAEGLAVAIEVIVPSLRIFFSELPLDRIPATVIAIIVVT